MVNFHDYKKMAINLRNITISYLVNQILYSNAKGQKMNEEAIPSAGGGLGALGGFHKYSGMR